jgi:hypothetical protein
MLSIHAELMEFKGMKESQKPDLPLFDNSRTKSSRSSSKVWHKANIKPNVQAHWFEMMEVVKKCLKHTRRDCRYQVL